LDGDGTHNWDRQKNAWLEWREEGRRIHDLKKERRIQGLEERRIHTVHDLEGEENKWHRKRVKYIT
jgi:hypothetical protein